MPRKPTKKPASDRIVYEVNTPQHGTRQVEASNTKELKAVLAPILPLDPYSVQAIAHLAQTEQATIQGTSWSVKRLGKLTFIPDEIPTPSGPRKKKEADKTSNAARPKEEVSEKDGVGERAGLEVSLRGEQAEVSTETGVQTEKNPAILLQSNDEQNDSSRNSGTDAGSPS